MKRKRYVSFMKRRKNSELWRVFFDSIAIKERENKKLQMENLPIEYRKNMTEFIV